MKKLLIFLLIPLFSFTQEQITEEKVIDNIKDFFSALNVKNYDKIILNQKVTTDFIIYEMGDKFTLNEFTDFIESAGYLGWESTEWFLSDFTISTIVIQRMSVISIQVFSFIRILIEERFYLKRISNG